jgi:hypothetical protein
VALFGDELRQAFGAPAPAGGTPAAPVYAPRP